MTALAPRARGGPPAEPRSEVVELCVFRVGDEEYALDLRRIREIVQPLPVTPVPGAAGVLDGVVEVRGEVLPLVDVRRRLGVVPRPGARAKVLVVNVAGRVLALVVDAVVEVVRVPRSSLGSAPLAGPGPRLFLGTCSTRARPGAAAASRKLRLLLNVKALLDPGAAAAAAALRRGGEA